MINSSVNPASASGSQALIKAQIDSSDTGNSVGKLFERRLFSLSTTSEPGNHQGIPRLNATVSNKNNRMYSNKVIGKPLEKREKITLSALNQLAAGCSAMAGSAWVRGVSLYNPANLTMSLMQQVPALVATVCPDCPGLISAAWSAASWGQAYGWANSIFTAMATGNIAAVAATAALCGASYASHHVSRDSVSQLCAQLPASVREYGEPWLQAATKVALAGALKAAGTVGGTARGSNDRFIVPEHEASHPSTEADLPPLVFDNRWDNHSEPHYATGIAMAMNTTENLQVRCSENSLPDFASSSDRPALYAPTVVSLQTVALPQTRTVILPANHTDHGQASPMPADAVPVSNPEGQGAVVGFLQLPLAEAGLIRSFTREQQKYHLHQAARQHQALPKQCPDLAGAVPGSNNGTVYPSESHTSGWVASPGGNQIFHYQLFSATPGSPLVTDTEGKQIPAPGFLRLAQTIQNGIKEHAVTDKTLPPNVVANQLPIASAHLSPPKIQNRLDPEVLATEVKNSTMLVLKPCNAKTGQPETSVLVLSADRAGRGVTINMGTDGFLEVRSLRARRQVLPDNGTIRLAPECSTEGSGYISGRLEMFVDGQWGSVTDTFEGSANDANARVACTQLGYPGSISSQIPVFMICAKRPKDVVVGNLHCIGNEKKLLDCPHQLTDTNYGFYIDDIAIQCQLFELSASNCTTESGSVLGRLRVFHNGTMGSVCNRGVGNGDAICKSLGFPGGVIKNTTESCATGSEPIHWAGLNCNGTEASPHDCWYNEQTKDCSHDDDLVLSCGPVVRLAQCQSESPGSVGGRLEVFVKGQWGTVCNTYFGAKDARVVCTQLGYPGVISREIPLAPTCPKAQGPVLRDYVHCTEKEKNFLDCPHPKWVFNDCGQGADFEDVALECQLFELSTNNCDAEPGSVLGRLRVFHNGTLGSVCNRGVGDGDAICKSLGFPGGVIINTTGSCTNSTGPIHWAGLSCNGTETSPHDCWHNEQTIGCSHEDDVVLSCGPLVRLAQCQTSGPGSVAGRLEVFVDEQWGTVSDHYFGSADARVACTQLGYPDVISRKIPVAPTCPEAPLRVMLDDIHCTGNEKKLLDCPHRMVNANYYFGHDTDAAVECQLFELSTNDCNVNPGSVLGILRVFHNGTLGSVCNRGADNGDTICKSLGYPGGVIKNITGSCTPGTGPIHWAGLSCKGTEASPHGCLHNEQTEGCTHKDDLVLNCSPVVHLAQCQTEGPGSVAGRLEVFVHGQWGALCGDHFNAADARVACTQLGYSATNASRIPVAPTCPQASRPIRLDNLHCTGNEKNLLDCLSGEADVRDCEHDDEIAIRCQMPATSTIQTPTIQTPTIQTPTIQTPTNQKATNQKATRSKLSSGIGWTIGGLAMAATVVSGVVFVGRSVYKNAKKPAQDNEDPATGRFIHKSGKTTRTRPWCLSRTISTQLLVGDESASSRAQDIDQMETVVFKEVREEEASIQEAVRE